MTCPKLDNADHHYGPINEKYTPLISSTDSVQSQYMNQ